MPPKVAITPLTVVMTLGLGNDTSIIDTNLQLVIVR